MPPEKNKTAAVIFWLLSLICMGIIFGFSARTATESSAQSGRLMALLTRLFGDNFFTDFLLRKTAHLLEYIGLAVCLSGAWQYTRGKASPLHAIVCTSAYAITDEWHQFFVEGRSCQFSDWLIDSCGGILGAACFLLLLLLIRTCCKKRIDRKEKAL